MPRVEILLKDWSLNATITSPNEAAGTPVANLLRVRHSSRWQTVNLVTMQATLDRGTPEPWDTVYIGYSNATENTTLRVVGADILGNLFTSPIHDSTALPFRVPGVGAFLAWHAYYHAPTQQTTRFVGIEIDDPTHPDGFFNAGVIMVGNIFRPALDAALGAKKGYKDLSVPHRMLNGEMVVRPRPRKKTVSYTWQHVNEVDMGFFDSAQQHYGESTPFLVKEEPVDPAYEHNGLLYGYGQWQQGQSIQRTLAETSSVRLRMEEL